MHSCLFTYNVGGVHKDIPGKLVSYLTYSKLSIQQEFETIKERDSPVGLRLAVDSVGLRLAVILVTISVFDSVGSGIHTGGTNIMTSE